MKTIDKYVLSRTAQRVFVESAAGRGSPPVYDEFKPVFDAKVDRIELNAADKPSRATIWFPDRRWHQRTGFEPPFNYGDKVKITIGDECVFIGFVVNYLSDFSGGSGDAGSAYERNAVVVYDFIWLLNTTSPILGQLIRGPDDYTDFGTTEQEPIVDSFTFLNGRRAVFNRDGLPNKSTTDYDKDDVIIPIFDNVDIAEYWTVRDMLCYVMSVAINRITDYYDFGDPANLPGLFDDSDFDVVVNSVCVDGLNIVEAIKLLCKSVGWSFRIDYDTGEPQLVFFKPGSAAGYSRTDEDRTILHWLYAPAVGEDISATVAAGKKLLWSGQFAQDIGNIVNAPWGMGAPDRFEFTAELVPAWKDDDLEPDTSDGNAHLFLTDADLQEEGAPDSYDYFKYYYPAGSDFRRNVGRRWSLNESGRYTSEDGGDRGKPFDFADIIDKEYILDDEGKRLYAPCNRQLLPALTIDPDTKNSIGIKVEFSFNHGNTWQTINASISSLIDECGIYIDEANLAELSDNTEGRISGGDLDGVALNLWTSLCDDKINGRSFKNGTWDTRVRVTASVQLDQRLIDRRDRRPTSGSPFLQSQIYDFSNKYGFQKRTASSKFDSSELPAWNRDDSDYFGLHLDSIQRACEDTSVSGQFTTERLWPNVFKVGDCIEKISGRDYSLAASFGEQTVFPEIIRIIILPDRQKQKLITRDLRFAETTLI